MVYTIHIAIVVRLVGKNQRCSGVFSALLIRCYLTERAGAIQIYLVSTAARWTLAVRCTNCTIGTATAGASSACQRHSNK